MAKTAADVLIETLESWGGGAVLDEALRTPGPVVVEAVVDPFEPPMPAKLEPKQAMHFAESLARGEPNRKEIALTMIANKVREMI